MSEVTVTRWTRFGKDRLYVSSADGKRLGWSDLITGETRAENGADVALVNGAVANWRATDNAGTSAGTPNVPAERVPAREPEHKEQGANGEPQWEDLAGRHAGEAAREQAIALRQAAPVRTFVARLLGVHTDERAWRIGADGEEKVAAQLTRLVRKDPRWKFLNAVPVGSRGSDIDHVVIGPGGVFTLNAKHHPGAKIWVSGNTFMVNGQRHPYIRNSRYEAARATRLLEAAAGVRVDAMGVVVPVGAQDVLIKTLPDGVHVVYRLALYDWLRRRPETLNEEQVGQLYDAARRSTTWVTSA